MLGLHKSSMAGGETQRVQSLTTEIFDIDRFREWRESLSVVELPLVTPPGSTAWFQSSSHSDGSGETT